MVDDLAISDAHHAPIAKPQQRSHRGSARTVLWGARWPGDIAIEGGIITAIGHVDPRRGDKRIDCSGNIVTAGLVNSHHHLYQWLTRGQAVNEGLFGWLRALYPVWAKLDPEDVHVAALVGLAELACSGATTVADHHYVVPGGDDSVFDAIAAAATRVGLRLHLSRGSMDLGESSGGLPPDSVVEDTDAILASTQAVASRLHDGERIWINVAPCSPFSVSSELLAGSAELARKLGLRLHTHLAETLDEERSCLERFGQRPVALLAELGWTGSDVWFAHGVHLDRDEVARLGETKTAIAHCPSSNARLASGICPVVDLRQAGSPVGLGVDGAASNEVGALQPEMRQALYFARLRSLDATAFQPADSLEIATAGGAGCLGIGDVGVLQIGAKADLAIWPADDLDDIADPVAALVLGPDRKVSMLLVGGEVVVDQGNPVAIDLHEVHRALSRRACKLWPDAPRG